MFFVNQIGRVEVLLRSLQECSLKHETQASLPADILRSGTTIIFHSYLTRDFWGMHFVYLN